MESIPFHLQKEKTKGFPSMTLKITPELNAMFELIADEVKNTDIIFSMGNKNDGLACLQVGSNPHKVKAFQENPDIFKLCKMNVPDGSSAPVISEIGSIHSKLIVQQTLSLEKKTEIKSKIAKAQRELKSRKAIQISEAPTQPHGKRGGQRRLLPPKKKFANLKVGGIKRPLPATQLESQGSTPPSTKRSTSLRNEGRRRPLPSTQLEIQGQLKRKHLQFNVEIDCRNPADLEWLTCLQINQLFGSAGKLETVCLRPFDLVSATVPSHLKLYIQFASQFEAEACVQLAQGNLCTQDADGKNQTLHADVSYLGENIGDLRPILQIGKGDPSIAAFALAVPNLFPNEVVDALLNGVHLAKSLPSASKDTSQWRQHLIICRDACRAAKLAQQVMELERDAMALRITDQPVSKNLRPDAAVRIATSLYDQFNKMMIRFQSQKYNPLFSMEKIN